MVMRKCTIINVSTVAVNINTSTACLAASTAWLDSQREPSLPELKALNYSYWHSSKRRECGDVVVV
jgi:hypothetical protein